MPTFSKLALVCTAVTVADALQQNTKYGLTAQELEQLAQVEVTQEITEVAPVPVTLDSLVLPAYSPAETTALELFGGSQGAKINGSTSWRGGGGVCKCCERPAGENGCLCYVKDINYAWFVPTDENGDCPSGSNPVQTDYDEVYEKISQCKNCARTQALEDKRALSSSSPAPETDASTEHYFQFLLCGGAQGYDQMVSNFCLCISDQGFVTQSTTFKDNLGRVMFTDTTSTDLPERQYEDFEKPCQNGDTVVFNALDYYQGFFGWCNAYDHEQLKQKICKVDQIEDKIDKVIRMLRGGKQKKRSKSRR